MVVVEVNLVRTEVGQELGTYVVSRARQIGHSRRGKQTGHRTGSNVAYPILIPSVGYDERRCETPGGREQQTSQKRQGKEGRLYLTLVSRTRLDRS